MDPDPRTTSGARRSRPQRGAARRRRALGALLVATALAAALPADGGGQALAQRRIEAAAPDAPRPAFARDGPFDASTVVGLARALAKAPYAAPSTALPEVLAKLHYDQYRDIRFRPEASPLARPGQEFQLQLFSLGYLFKSPVELALVQGGQARHLAYRPDMFDAGKLVPGPLPSEDVGFSGFRLVYPLNVPDRFDEVAVFQGASYFRSLGRGQAYGLSARGLALKVGDPAGEEFPVFRAFWIEEPSPRSYTVVVHALLDSPSVAGAYRFRIVPGRETVMDVEAVLFPRVDLTEVGLAPGTSMYMFSPTDRGRADDFRPQVHDSDGLLMLNGRGEQLFRPLANPTKLQLSSFQDRAPKGFGLVQRDRNPEDYQDFEASFERRPSLWVEPVGDWGEGSVVLVEIPSDSEIHDNIVSFWRPRQPVRAGSELRIAYRLTWGTEPEAARQVSRVLLSAVGRSDVEAPTPVRRFVVDYSGSPACSSTPCSPPKAQVTSSAGKVRDVVVQANPLTGGYRVSFVLDPEKAELCELRLELAFDDSRRAEVWVYRWTKA
jgi:periplasmic glucans biosynthesis protein